MAGPDQVVVDGNVATATGDQSNGIASGIDFFSPPVIILNVNNLDAEISTQNRAGILLRNNDGSSLALTSGDSQKPVVIDTNGDGAHGIEAVSDGAPAMKICPGLN